MWCAACRADVAAELSADNRRMLCARCQSELGTAAGALERPGLSVKSQDTERNARELLARWSTQHLLEPPIGPAPIAVPAVTTGSVDPRSGYSGLDALSAKSSRRFDSAHAATSPPVMPVMESSHKSSQAAQPPHGSDEDAPVRKRRKKLVSRPRLAEDSSREHAESVPAPKNDDLVRMAVQEPLARQGNWTTTIGQLCAYGGVAVLTLGTVMVLAGYFGGPTNYAPTGWLVAAVGQMLLFLGVVTLVSGGMEQTVDEVAWRIDHLADQIQRLERVITEQDTQLKEARRREIRRAKISRGDQADAA